MVNLSNLPIGIQVIDAQMRYVFLNDRILSQVGKSLDEHVGKRMEEVYPGIENSDIYKAIQKCHKTGVPKRVHNEYVMPDGKLTYWELDLKRIENEVLILSRDITESAEGKKLLLKSNIRLEEEVEIRTKQLTESNKQYKRLVSELTHDIRGPLYQIHGLIEMIESNEIDRQQSQAMTNLLKNMTDKLLKLMGRILEDAALTSGKIQLKKSKNNLCELLDDRISALQRFGKMDSYKISVNADKDFVRTFDPIRMTQVIDNLLSNTIRYALPQSTIEISINSNGSFSIKNKIDHEKVKAAKAANDIELSAGFGQEIIKYILEGHNTQLQINKTAEYYEASFQLPE